jgi:arabinose-5-phosphate isomerase
MRTGDEMPLVKLATPMTETIIEMTAKRLGCVGVLSDTGSFAGIITDGDLRLNMENDILDMGNNILAITAGEVMTPDPKRAAKIS